MTAPMITQDRKMIGDRELGDILNKIIAEAMENNYSGVDVSWTDTQGKEIKRSVIDF